MVLPFFPWVGLLFSPPLLLGGAAWSTPPWGCVASCSVSSSFGRCCFFNLLSGGPAFLPILLVGLPSITSNVPPLFCWVVLLGLLLLWGGVAIPLSFGVELPYFRSFGCWLRSPSLLFRGVVFLSLPLESGAFVNSSVVWCCLVSSSFGRCCFSSLLLCAAAFLFLLWVGLLFPRLQLGGAAWSTRVVLLCFCEEEGLKCNPSSSDELAAVEDIVEGLGEVESLSPHLQWEHQNTNNQRTTK